MSTPAYGTESPITPAPKRQSIMAQEGNKLTAQMDRLTESINRLIDRVESVCRPPCSADHKEAVEPPPGVPMAGFLHEITHRLSKLADIVDDARERVEL